MKKILIIGAGIHGCFLAKYLKKYDVEIVILDKNNDICEGTSNATHNRANRGYHYPRSNVTAKECALAFNYFAKNYKKFLTKSKSYYCIERNSKTNLKDYIKFIIRHNLEFKIQNKSKFIKKKNLEAIVVGQEGCYNHPKIKKFLKEEITSKKIKFINNYDLKKATFLDNKVTLANNENKIISINFDFIINTTYDKSNLINNDIFKLKVKNNYLFQLTEIAVVKSKIKFPSMTIMDGLFITLMPYIGKKNHYLLYDVTNSIMEVKKNEFSANIKKTNFNKMIKKASKYFFFTDTLKYVKSCYGMRPIPIKDINADRSTKITMNKWNGKNIYTFNEGKYISAPLMAKEFTQKLWEKKIIEK